MRNYIAIIALIFSSFTSSSQDVKIDSTNAFVLNQLNGEPITVVGRGNMHLSYSETIDGYTIIRNNEGIYEYAELSSKGQLKPSGVAAHDPGNRDEKEKKHVNKLEKHLRHEDPYLSELRNKQDRFFNLERYAPDN